MLSEISGIVNWKVELNIALNPVMEEYKLPVHHSLK